ncbi:hypothetical protein QQS21_010778 [Conoideocrella luteorostrata]|uniref:Uncharacterized protein n=1 Tax=Conoideocrella luteorostrata TaxID=1105319 RepID=A0AAJ0CGN6_9HYPO|nr:hypothetical protein QQS21_010778 [Conoideocrella luteorostrata]
MWSLDLTSVMNPTSIECLMGCNKTMSVKIKTCDRINKGFMCVKYDDNDMHDDTNDCSSMSNGTHDGAGTLGMSCSTGTNGNKMVDVATTMRTVVVRNEFKNHDCLIMYDRDFNARELYIVTTYRDCDESHAEDDDALTNKNYELAPAAHDLATRTATNVMNNVTTNTRAFTMRRSARPGSSINYAPMVVSCTWDVLNVDNIERYMGKLEDLTSITGCIIHKDTPCKGHHMEGPERRGLDDPFRVRHRRRAEVQRRGDDQHRGLHRRQVGGGRDGLLLREGQG